MVGGEKERTDGQMEKGIEAQLTDRRETGTANEVAELVSTLGNESPRSQSDCTVKAGGAGLSGSGCRGRWGSTVHPDRGQLQY